MDMQPKTPSSVERTIGAVTSPCSGCGSRELPDASGLCPTSTCRRFRVGNSSAVVHMARARLTVTDLSNRDELVAGLLAERAYDIDLLTRVKINDCATATVMLQRVSRRLEEIGPTTAAGRTRSLVPIYTALSARVEKLSGDLALVDNAPTDRVTKIEHVIVYPRLELLPTPVSDMAHDLLSREASGEPLTDRERGALDVLESIISGSVSLPGESSSAAPDQR